MAASSCLGAVDSHPVRAGLGAPSPPCWGQSADPRSKLSYAAFRQRRPLGWLFLKDPCLQVRFHTRPQQTTTTAACRRCELECPLLPPAGEEENGRQGGPARTVWALPSVFPPWASEHLCSPPDTITEQHTAFHLTQQEPFFQCPLHGWTLPRWRRPEPGRTG